MGRSRSSPKGGLDAPCFLSLVSLSCLSGHDFSLLVWWLDFVFISCLPFSFFFRFFLLFYVLCVLYIFSVFFFHLKPLVSLSPRLVVFCVFLVILSLLLFFSFISPFASSSHLLLHAH